MGENVVSQTRVAPATALLRARLVTALVLLVSAGLAVVSVLVGMEGDAGISLIIAGWLVLMFLPWLPCAMKPVVDGTDLTARTFSGRRTLDLRRLAKVRRVRIVGRPRELDTLVLLDTNGVRLAVNSPEVDDAVAAALTNPGRAQPSMSAFAGHRLGLVELRLRSRAFHDLWALAAFLLYVFVTLFAVITVAVVIGMSTGSMV